MGLASAGFDPGARRDAGDVRARGRGAPNGRAGAGRAGARGCGRHAPAGVSWGRASGWAGRVRFPSLGDLGAGRGPVASGLCLAVAEGGVRPRSLLVPTCVQDLRDGVNAFPCSTQAGGSPPHASPQSPACVATF